jgi:hypothetical protein
MGAVILWSALGWVAVIPCAIANGALREFVLAPRLGMRTAQPVSGLLLALAIAAIVAVMVGRIGPRPTATFVGIGLAWLAATVGFEFAIGLAAGKDWPAMLAPYRFADNNLWPLVLVWIALAPWLIARWRGVCP